MINLGVRPSKELNKWFYGLRLSANPYFVEWLPYFEVWCFKFKKLPEYGAMIGKEDIKGFSVQIGIGPFVEMTRAYVLPEISFGDYSWEYHKWMWTGKDWRKGRFLIVRFFKWYILFTQKSDRVISIPVRFKLNLRVNVV